METQTFQPSVRQQARLVLQPRWPPLPGSSFLWLTLFPTPCLKHVLIPIILFVNDISVSTSRERNGQQCKNKLLRSSDNGRPLNHLEYLAFAFVPICTSDAFTELPCTHLCNKYLNGFHELGTVLSRGYMKNVWNVDPVLEVKQPSWQP